MKRQSSHLALLLTTLLSVSLVASKSPADETAPASPPAGNQAGTPDTRYGLFNGLDHRSSYGQDVFPEPFLVDDSDLEDNEARVDWLQTQAGGLQNDTVTSEVEKGFGQMTLEIEVPYERDVTPGESTESGVGNIDLGARYPLYEYVAASGSWDTAFGAAVEVGVPVNSPVSKNTELVPKVFNDLRVGDHFTLQSIFGYSTLFGGGDNGGLQTFESGFVFGCTLQHREFPIPGVQQFIPMFELVGDTAMNHDDPGQTSIVGDACFRVNLNAFGAVQPRLGLGFVFPINDNARADVHWGIVTSLVFEY